MIRSTRGLDYINGGFTVSIEVELSQLFEAVEGVGPQAADVVLGQRQMLHRCGNVLRNLSQSSSVAQHLHGQTESMTECSSLPWQNPERILLKITRL